MLEAIAGSSTLATFIGTQTRPAALSNHDLTLVKLRAPTPTYPHSLICHQDNAHPALAQLWAHAAATARRGETDTWSPG